MEKEKLIEIISVFFSNTYVCNLYDQAKHFNNTDINATYINVLEEFNRAVRQNKAIHGKQKEYYPTIIRSIKDMYNSYLKRNESYNSFVNVMIKLLLPSDKTKPADKINNVKLILTKSISEFTVNIINNHSSELIKIKSDKNNTETIIAFNTKMKNLFKSILEREIKLFSNIVISKRNGVDLNNNHAQTISDEIISNMEYSIIKILEEKNELVEKYNKIYSYLLAALEENKKLKEKLNRFTETKIEEQEESEESENEIEEETEESESEEEQEESEEEEEDKESEEEEDKIKIEDLISIKEIKKIKSYEGKNPKLKNVIIRKPVYNIEDNLLNSSVSESD